MPRLTKRDRETLRAILATLEKASTMPPGSTLMQKIDSAANKLASFIVTH